MRLRSVDPQQVGPCLVLIGLRELVGGGVPHRPVAEHPRRTDGGPAVVDLGGFVPRQQGDDVGVDRRLTDRIRPGAQVINTGPAQLETPVPFDPTGRPLHDVGRDCQLPGIRIPVKGHLGLPVPAPPLGLALLVKFEQGTLGIRRLAYLLRLQ